MVEEEAIPRPDPDVLRDALALAERSVDKQLTMADGRLRKIEALTRLGVVGLAGILAIIGLLVNAGVPLGGVPSVGLGLGILANVIALITFLQAVSGFPQPYQFVIGPRIHALLQELRDPPDHPTFRISLLKAFDRAFEENERLERAIDARTSAGIMWLLLATFIHISTLAYVLGVTIHV